MSPMNANASMPVQINKTGIDRFVKLKARNLISGVIDAMEDELSDRRDLELRRTPIQTTAVSVKAGLKVKSRQTDIRKEDIGTETRAPAHTVSRLVKDPDIRARLLRKAARSL